MSSIVDKLEDEDIPKQLKKCNKIKIYPTEKQINLWNEWLNTSRYYYNKSLEVVKKKECVLDKHKLRDYLVTKETRKTHVLYDKYTSYLNDLVNFKAPTEVLKEIKYCIHSLPTALNENVKQWQIRTPKSIREQAVNDLYNAYTTNLKMFKEGKKKYFEMSFRKKSSKSHTFAMDSSVFGIKEDGIYISTEVKGNREKVTISKQEWKRLKVAYDKHVLAKSARILKDHHGWWILIAENVGQSVKNEPKSIVGGDLGVRDFLALYGITSEQIKITNVNYRRTMLNALRNKIKLLKTKRLKRKNRVLKKYEYKIQNIVKDMHYNVVKFLINNYDAIIIGDINSQGILQGQLKSITKQEIQDLSFYKFKQRLKEKAIINGNYVKLVNEAYTSKTCTYCGNMYNIGSSKVYDCKNCNRTYDRDEGSARNILMKGILL